MSLMPSITMLVAKVRLCLLFRVLLLIICRYVWYTADALCVLVPCTEQQQACHVCLLGDAWGQAWRGWMLKGEHKAVP